MTDVLQSPEISFVGSLAEPSTRWFYWDQSMIKNVRVEVVRNLDDMPTLAGLTESSTAKLLDIQQKVFDGLKGMT